jgi:hypothetical protein
MADVAGPGQQSSSSSPSWLEQGRSCLPCRATGSLTFGGVSGWLLYERSKLAAAQRGHRATLAVMSVAFAGAAVARWFV